MSSIGDGSVAAGVAGNLDVHVIQVYEMKREGIEISDVQQRLTEHARSKCVPFLLDTVLAGEHLDWFAVVLVGSVAAGQCRNGSDIDIAIMGSKENMDLLPEGARWAHGKPTETNIEGVQLHCYGISFEEVDERLKLLDDAYFYDYGNAVPLHDPSGLFADWAGRARFGDAELTRERIESGLDMLMRRVLALEQALDAEDHMNVAGIALEVVSRSLGLIALLEGAPFNPRKRLFESALRCPLGKTYEALLRACLRSIGEVGNAGDGVEFGGLNTGSASIRLTEAILLEAKRRGYEPRRH